MPTHRHTHPSPNLKGPTLKILEIQDQATALHIITEIIITIMITGSCKRQPHARFDERYNQRYSPPVFPSTPSLNSSFPEALSKSLLQIAENQSRTIEAMEASQEAQAAAYKEMTKTNKMCDDSDALFHSIEVYDGSNPTKFEKWIDSIDQTTCITDRDLRKELLKKSDSVIRNTLSMMDDRWTDDAIIAKLHQDFSSLSTMNRLREELKNLYQ